ncbi:MAG: 2-oxo-4-hydroxy-4-carboxy-5-ureidoimidazoline decarboxylase [Robiginitomaculum sp.]|nr:2-oxo-4-hydroxy-4-carboxy-5-ureidoimidazoline decarboxylase [Robiginitomaculum sp.]
MKPSTLNQQTFLDTFGGVYERSPWVANAAWQAALDRTVFDTASGLAATLSRAMHEADIDKKLELIRAHPDLAGKAAMADELTDESKSEQTGAGLDRCTPEEFASFTQLNNAYLERFGFPFIIAVKGHTVGSILQAFTRRIEHDQLTEMSEALRQIDKIAAFRIEEIFT